MFGLIFLKAPTVHAAVVAMAVGAIHTDVATAILAELAVVNLDARWCWAVQIAKYMGFFISFIRCLLIEC